MGTNTEENSGGMLGFVWYREDLKKVTSTEKKMSRVFELYEKIFSLKQDGSNVRSVTDYFASLKGAADEILLYHPLGCDAQTSKTQWNEFLVAKFLSGLHPNLRFVRDNLLANDTVPTLSNALSRVLQVATTGSSEPLSTPTTKIWAMGIRGRDPVPPAAVGDIAAKVTGQLTLKAILKRIIQIYNQQIVSCTQTPEP
ncbi:hypothetical protein CDL12_27069 [Handroanthus impetiginosus]|uniref:Uncharacterized protein n=1 Tax=Handroanthus impetiginosus TaxID=429701 RepID=A0A2G9G678_9LAMI|nr:hypothetical protein CDL12_27069 [Handroanthus impetiginosus]